MTRRTSQLHRINERLDAEIKADPFAYALAELKRIDRECREAHARFVEASQAAQDALQAAGRGLG